MVGSGCYRKGLTVSPLKRRRSHTLSGYKPLGGKSRRYRIPSGETISRRQYENLRLKGRGINSWSQIQRAKPTTPGITKEDYVRWRDRASKVHGISERDLNNPDSEFNRLLAKAADDDFDHRAGSTFDDFLVYLDYRDEDTDVDIGVDSP